MIYVWVVVPFLAVGAGLYMYRSQSSYRAMVVSREEGGWVYFLGAIGGENEDPPSPIKVGMTHRNPRVDRLPEIETMSPKPLELIYMFYDEWPKRREHLIHNELAPFRRHGEWFDRDAVMAWVENHKENA